MSWLLSIVFLWSPAMIGITLAQTCSWQLFPDTKISGGTYAPASTVSDCQATCRSTAGCQSVDFNVAANGCYLLNTQSGKTATAGVNHYDYVCIDDETTTLPRTETTSASTTPLPPLPPPETCSIPFGFRLEGGWYGISESECRNRFMCWDPNQVGAKWCFQPINPQCIVDPTNRVECGWAGITPQQCIERGCCFNSGTDNVKWCYQQLDHLTTKLPAPATCNVSPNDRLEGGFRGISLADCQSRGACWDEITPNAKWCFRPLNPRCFVDPLKRVEGGWPGITTQQCVDRGNCFNSGTPDSKWCFKPSDA